MRRLSLFLSLVAVVGAVACDGRGLVDGTGMTWVRFVDGSGNVLVSQDGRFTMRFPEGALKEGMALEVRQLTPDDGRYAGILYQVRRIDAGAGEIQLQKPATVTLRWVDTPLYLDPPLLGRVGENGAWQPEAFVRESGKLVARKVMRTGTFGAWDACGSDAGCADGFICEGGACGKAACVEAADCGAFSECMAGRCVGLCASIECTPGSACDARNTCELVDGCPKCVPVEPTCIPTTENCLDGVDNDCDELVDLEDPDCAEIACSKANNSECPRDMYCVDGTCRECRDNYDCTAKDVTTVCTASHTCDTVMGCRSDAECPPESGCEQLVTEDGSPYSMCISCPAPDSAYRCNYDLECGKGYICENWGNAPSCNLCFPAQCTTSASCPDGEQCLGGRCRNTRCTDQDMDGYPAEANCGAPQDCNDASPSIYPGARERCNNLDDDCNGVADDDDPLKMCQGIGGYCMDGKCF